MNLHCKDLIVRLSADREKPLSTWSSDFWHCHRSLKNQFSSNSDVFWHCLSFKTTLTTFLTKNKELKKEQIKIYGR
jgi:hypothetical protein